VTIRPAGFLETEATAGVLGVLSQRFTCRGGEGTRRGLLVSERRWLRMVDERCIVEEGRFCERRECGEGFLA